MRAVFIEEHGGPEVLQLGELPVPELQAGEVLVRLEVAALNRMDLWVRAGWPGIRLAYPHVLGADGAGQVAGLGAGVQGFATGDRVVVNANLGCGQCQPCQAGADNRCKSWNLLGETIQGTYAEYVRLPARNLMPVPESCSLRGSAAAGLVFHTAWHSLITRGRLQPGERVLVIGASGGVNTASIQIARLSGAEVFVVGSSAQKLALAESLGADHLIDRSQEPDWSRTIYQLTGREGVDVVVDNIGTTFPLSFRAARKGGRILTVGNTGAPRFEIDNRYIFGKHLSIIGSTMGTLQDFREVMGLVFAGKLHPVLDREYPLEEAQAAHQRLEDGAQLGKITLAV